jgi:hypothetical protein
MNNLHKDFEKNIKKQIESDAVIAEKHYLDLEIKYKTQIARLLKQVSQLENDIECMSL